MNYEGDKLIRLSYWYTTAGINNSIHAVLGCMFKEYNILLIIYVRYITYYILTTAKGILQKSKLVVGIFEISHLQIINSK